MLLWAVVVVLAAGLSGLVALLVQLVQQQGRILLRLDSIEEVLSRSGQGDVLEVARHDAAHTADRAGQAVPGALPPGAPVSLVLSDLDGQRVTLEGFRGRQVLLTHWSPHCGFCDVIAGDLAGLQDDLVTRDVELVLVSWGDPDTNRAFAREHGLERPILLVDGPEPPAPFSGMGTPVAYLLDGEGRVAKPVAVGADAVAALAREAAGRRPRLRTERSLNDSRIERDGLKAGTPAPAFDLPEVGGGRVSLEDYRGRRVLLVFSDPECGPCQDLAPELGRLHEEHRDEGPDLIMVGRGDAEQNRAQAAEHGLRFPVVLQERWKLSKAYGIFATPVAFLIDEEGVIERDVATGGDEILALARQGLGKEQIHG